MFGTDHEKLSKKEIKNGIYNSELLNAQAMEAFCLRLEDMERIHAKGPTLHADVELVRECINFVMREMIGRDLKLRLKPKIPHAQN